MTDKEYKEEITKYINRLKIIRKEYKEILIKIIGNNLLREDLYFISLIDRSLNLIDGTIKMFIDRNLTCIGVLLRIQMDNCLRLYSIFIAEDKNKVIECIISGGKMNSKKDKNGRFMTDGYLKREIAKIDPTFPEVYNGVCGYIHFSSESLEKLFDEVKDGKFIMKVGLSLPERKNKDLIGLAKLFEHYLKLQYKMLTEIVESKSRFDSKNDIKYKLVKASREDIPRLIQYKKDIIYMYSKGLAEDERNKIDEYVINSVNEMFKDYYNIIIDDKIIGSVCIKDLENAKLLDEIYLEKEFRNNGIGTDIIMKLLKESNNKNIYLWVYKENSKAVLLYKRLGFKIIDETEFRYYMEYNVKR